MAEYAGAYYENASAGLLASIPAKVRSRYYQGQDPEWEPFRLQLEQRLYALRNWRLSWWEHWARLAEAILPRRYHWLVTPNTMTRGLAINQMIVDPTGAQAVRVCSAGLRSGLMSSSRPWFKIRPGLKSFKPDRAAQLWFEDTEDRLYRVIEGSNYYKSGTQMFEDLTVFGTAPKILYEDFNDIIRCYNPCAGEYFLGTDSAFRINSFYRTFVLTVMQTVGMFGYDKVGPEVQGLFDMKGASLETEVIVAHAIEPNFPAGQPGENPNLGVIPGGFPYREVYWLWGKPTPSALSTRPFRRKPFIAPRWATTSNDAYGRSPGMDALPDILQLHQMTRRQGEAIDKLVRPPMLAHTTMKNQPASILPGRVSFTNNLNEGMKPVYQVEPNINEMSQLIEKIEARVEKWFFNDRFQMMANLEGVQPRNEMEIAERRGENLQVLGPIVDDITTDLRDDIKGIYSIANRRGLIRPKPESLLGVPLDIEFDTMIAQAQRAAITATMERGAAVATNLAKNGVPQALDVVNWDRWQRKYDDVSGMPIETLNSEEETAGIRQQRAQAQAQEKQEQTAMVAATHAAPGVAKAAKDLSQAGGGQSTTAPQLGAPQLDTGGALNALQIMAGMGGASSGATGLPQ